MSNHHIAPVTNTPSATATVTDEQAAAASRLVDMYISAATQSDNPQLKSAAAYHIGYEKYLDHCRLLRPTDRNPTEQRERALAAQRLPHIQDFIYQTDADNLRHLIAGMMAGLQRHVPRHESQYRPGTDDLIHLTSEPGSIPSEPTETARSRAIHADIATLSFAETANLMANLEGHRHRHDTHDQSHTDDPAITLIARALQARLVELRWEEVIADFEGDDDVLRNESAFHIGTLKIINERDLRLFDYTSRRHRLMVRDASDDLEVIDRLVGIAEADQMREIVAGITSRIHLLDD